MRPSPDSPDNQSNASRLLTLRQALHEGFSALEIDFTRRPDINRLFRQHCALIDQLLSELWSSLDARTSCCLIAVGGYGRGELFPHSDIDLLILTPQSSEQALDPNKDIEQFVGWMWDIGLNVGHSVRSLDECIEEAQKDVTVQTNLLESRLLSGNQSLYAVFRDKTRLPDDPVAFFQAKLKEQEQRYAKYNDTAYNLEPNIKESPGALRDLHMVAWLARSLNLFPNAQPRSINLWSALARIQVITATEARQIRHYEKKLQLLRIHLHFLSGRREDRLLFDFQNELAKKLGYTNNPRKRASEQLMQSYYRSVKFISFINEILMKQFKQMLSDKPPLITPINAHFEARDQLLEARTAGLLQQKPTAIFEAFLILQQRPEINGMGANLLRNLQRVKKLVNQDFRQSPQNRKLFIEILSQPTGIHHALRAMNRYGILGSYIPAFGRIIGQMQHDLFHVYTVDEHILNVLANLRRFSKPELKHEFPLCSQIFSEFDAPYLLYLAALFHDIAKGRGGDHSILGKSDAMRFCRLHGMSKTDSALVAWLVESHLKMSATAQKSDLTDPAVIESFAHLVQNERRLNALYLLTVADIRGTSPLIWNGWKARLLENLYLETKRALENPAFHTKQIIAKRIEEASEKLTRFGISADTYENMWEQFGENYFVRHETNDIAWHSRLLTPHLHTSQSIVRARLSPYGDGIQVMIYTKDQHEIFARICNFFDRTGYNIVEAKIYTTKHGYALDSFIILDQANKAVSYSGLLKFIETKLTDKLDNRSTLESPLKGRVSRQVKHMPIQAQITIKEEPENNNHTLDMIANDRPGLLATVAQQFLIHDVELHNAKINTLGNRAEDTFLISARNGERLDLQRIQSLHQSLLKNI